MNIRSSPKLGSTSARGLLPISLAVCVGFFLSFFAVRSPLAGLVALACGTALTLTFFLRKIDVLIIGWFFLTATMSLVLQLLPPEYSALVGRSMFWGLIICVLVAWFIDHVMSRNPFEKFDYFAAKALLFIFLFWCTVTVTTSLDAYNSTKKLSHIVIALAGFYMFYDFFSQSKKNLDRVLRLLLILVVVISFAELGSVCINVAKGEPIYKRISLWFYNPNSLGLLLSMTIPILFASESHLVQGKGRRYFLASIMLLALFFTFSRASWVAAFVSLVFLSLKGRMRIPLGAIVVAGLFAAALLLPAFGEQVFGFITGNVYTGRKEIWTAALKTAMDYPLFGTGPGNWFMVMPQYIETPWLKNLDPHSLYLRNLAEMGFLSLLIMLAYLGAFFYTSERIERDLRSDYLKLLTRGATATILGVCAHGVFENGFLLSSFDAAEFTVMTPYIVMAIPFAARNLDSQDASDS